MLVNALFHDKCHQRNIFERLPGGGMIVMSDSTVWVGGGGVPLFGVPTWNHDLLK